MEGRFVVLACLAASIALSHAKPNFCRSYDCPGFTTDDAQSNNDFKVRRYDASSWVGYSQQGSSVDNIANGMFMKLFRYIGGSNADGASIKMTVPVATKVQAIGGGQYRVTMMFYLKTNSPPAPTETGVAIVTLPARDFYVRPFSTWFSMASDDRYQQEADSLRDDADRRGLSYDTSSYFKVSYASPWWPIKKYQEVWLISN